MSLDERDTLEVLRMELDYLEAGGYGRSVRRPWQPTSIFQDSLSCVNYGYPYRAHPCDACLLDDFVPEDKRAEAVPCHHIPLDERGETVEDLEMRDNQSLLEETVRRWLRARIAELEAQRAVEAAAPNAMPATE